MLSRDLLEPRSVPRVTRGVRLAQFSAVEYMVCDDSERALLGDLNTAIRRLADREADPTAVVLLTDLYHKLLIKWGTA